MINMILAFNIFWSPTPFAVNVLSYNFELLMPLVILYVFKLLMMLMIVVAM